MCNIKTKVDKMECGTIIVSGELTCSNEEIEFDSAYSFIIKEETLQRITKISKYIKEESLLDASFITSSCSTGIVGEDGFIDFDVDVDTLHDHVETTLCIVGASWFYIEARLKYDTSVILKGELLPLSELI